MARTSFGHGLSLFGRGCRRVESNVPDLHVVSAIKALVSVQWRLSHEIHLVGRGDAHKQHINVGCCKPRYFLLEVSCPLACAALLQLVPVNGVSRRVLGCSTALWCKPGRGLCFPILGFRLAHASASGVRGLALALTERCRADVISDDC